MKKIVTAALMTAAIAMSLACGGGGSSSSVKQPVVIPAPTLVIVTSGLSIGVQGVAYQDVVTATTGTGPYTFTVQGGMPAGLSFSSSGTISGTPTQIGSFALTFTATDSGTPAAKGTKTLMLNVVAPQTVRDDTLAGANSIPCCGTIHASLSPYATAAGVAAPDHDYYKFTASPNDRISVDAVRIGTVIDTDPVVEILDANGARMVTCKTPQAPAAFNQSCLNDDIDPGVVRNSHLDVQLPASTGVFVVHVFDWGGRARPEMTYELRTVKLP